MNVCMLIISDKQMYSFIKWVHNIFTDVQTNMKICDLIEEKK